MELHETIRELVESHGPGIFSDASGFRGVLDDVLDERDATTGDINLLVDAVRFDVLAPLTEMIEGGADAGRAVEEAGVRLARNRGGDGHTSASWAAAVLGYAVGKVPEAVVLRYRSHRAPGAYPSAPPASWPPAGPPVASPGGPPFVSPGGPPFVSPGGPAVPPPPPAPAASGGAPQPPTVYPGSGSLPQAPVQPGFGSVPGGPPAPAYPGAAPKPRKKRTGLIIGGIAALVLIAGGGTIAAVTLTGGDDDGGGGGTDHQAADGPDVSAEALDGRYADLASAISTASRDCKAGETTEGQKEVVTCTETTGTLTLVTYADQASFTKGRKQAVDTREGTLAGVSGSNQFYEYDPEYGNSDRPAVIYWDSQRSLQSATITGNADIKLSSINAVYLNTSPKVTAPTTIVNPQLRTFIDINMDADHCTREVTSEEGETEAASCTVPGTGPHAADIDVYVGRFTNKRGLIGKRVYVRRLWREADQHTNKDYWHFGDGKREGDLRNYGDKSSATIYWDLDEPGCNCWAMAYYYGKNPMKALDAWWPN